MAILTKYIQIVILLALAVQCTQVQNFYSCPLETGQSCEEESQFSEMDTLLILAAAASAYSMNESEISFASLMNEHRATVGCSALIAFGGLNSTARAHSQDMHDRSYFSHTNPEGNGPGDRFTNNGFTSNGIGENIAAGYGSPQSVLTGWLNSSGHRANIENCSYTHHGIGYVEDGNYWTNMFGINPS